MSAETAEKPPKLSIVTCHPDTPEVPVLRDSFLAHVGPGDTEIVVSVGANSIAEAYNKGVKSAGGSVLIFTHSDVEMMCSRRTLAEAIKVCEAPNCGVVGIAGSRVLREDCIWWAQRDQLSGSCMHRDQNSYWMTAFGHYGQVAVLDGVFLMVKKRLFEELGGFDQSFPGWDFYDVDFTLRAHLKEYINVTFPILCLHHSVGDVRNKPGWHDNRDRMIAKWKDTLPVVAQHRELIFESPSGGEVDKAKDGRGGSGTSEQGGLEPSS